MRVLLIHQAFISPTEGGGTRHYEFARYCITQGYEFVIIASNLNYLTGQRVTNKKGFITEQNLDGIKVLRAYTYPALHKSFVWRVVSFICFMITSFIAALRVRDIDVVMGTSPPIFQAVSAWLVALIRRKPFLLEIRDLWPAFAIDMGVLKNPVLIKLSRWLEAFLYARAHHIVVNSPAYRDYLLEKDIEEEKISIVLNGVDPDMFDPTADGKAFRKKFNLDGKFVVTYAGALGMANDIPTILQAAKRLKDRENIQFLIVGDGKERPHLEETAKKWHLTNVTFIGSQPKSNMPMILAASDVCVATLQDIPMFRTTYPNKVFDYMAAERPTILAIDGVIRDVIEKSGGGIFVHPADDAALADAILSLHDDQGKVCTMGRDARAYVVKYLNRTRQAAQFVDVLQNVVTAKHK